MSSLALIIVLYSVVSKACIILVDQLWCNIILRLHNLHHFMYLLQLCRQLLLGGLYFVWYMIAWLCNIISSIGRLFLLMKDFLQSCDHIVHHVRVVHSLVLYGEVRRIP